MDEEEKIEGVKSIMSVIYSSLHTLRIFAPEYRWKGLGNVLGDYGECVAIDHYNLTKAPPGTEGHDATTSDGKTVAIKANHASHSIGFRGEADLLLVLSVGEDGGWSEIYYGPFKPVRDASRFSKRDNKHIITVRKLRDEFGNDNYGK